MMTHLCHCLQRPRQPEVHAWLQHPVISAEPLYEDRALLMADDHALRVAVCVRGRASAALAWQRRTQLNTPRVLAARQAMVASMGGTGDDGLLDRLLLVS